MLGVEACRGRLVKLVGGERISYLVIDIPLLKVDLDPNSWRSYGPSDCYVVKSLITQDYSYF